MTFSQYAINGRGNRNNFIHCIGKYKILTSLFKCKRCRRTRVFYSYRKTACLFVFLSRLHSQKVKSSLCGTYTKVEFSQCNITHIMICRLLTILNNKQREPKNRGTVTYFDQTSTSGKKRKGAKFIRDKQF